ncbi:MAG TPA: VRR-NUC domain-containing protein [Clostridia bacterium]|nr:VRR-NUC domain-containing protein [Clostridia bacterium]
MVRENAVVKSIKNYLDTLNYCYYHKTHSGRYSMKGKPDITGCLYGIRFEIECKVEGEEARPLQKAVIRKWGKAGAVAFVAHNVDDVKLMFQPIFENKIMLTRIMKQRL